MFWIYRGFLRGIGLVKESFFINHKKEMIMSLENAKKMLELLKTDKALLEKVKAADNEGKKKNAADLGLNFTSDDMKAAIKSNSELSDDDLASVAGGSSAVWVGTGAAATGAAAACGW